MRQIKKKKKKKNFVIPLKWKIGALLGGCFLIGGIIFFQTQTGKNVIQATQNIYTYVKYKSGLYLKTVIVDGHARTDIKEINQKIGLTQGMPILDVDLDFVQNQIKTLPWIREVIVERYLPNTIYIKIVEKTPIALWQNQKKYWPVDEEGKIIQDNKTPVGSVLLVVGDDALEYTPDLIQTLEKYPSIREKARSAVRVGNRRWNLILNDIDDGLVIELPESNIEKALERIVKKDEKDNFLKRDLKCIDVRLPDRIIVQKVSELKQGKNQK